MTSLPHEILGNGIGARIEGLDLSKPLGAEQAEAFTALFNRYGLLVIPGQTLSHDDQWRAMRYLGPAIDPRLERDCFVTNRPGWGGQTQQVELCFHSDFAFFEEPATGLSLHALELVDHGSATRFASARAAYRSLDAETRTLADRVSTRHVFPTSVERRERDVVALVDRPEYTRALVQYDERSGERYVYMSYMMIDGIPELDAEASEALIHKVYAALEAPENIYVHSWCKHDLVIWNNLTFQHARGDITDVGARVLQKAYLMSQPTLPRYPESLRAAMEDNLRTGRQMYEKGGRIEGVVNG